MATTKLLSGNLLCFKKWCGSNGVYKGYAENLHRWAQKVSNKDGFLIDILPEVYSWDPQKEMQLEDVLIADALNEKYSHYKMLGKKNISSKKSKAESKKGNTADNLVSHLNKYFEFVKENSCPNTQLTQEDKDRINDKIKAFKKATIKDSKEFLYKIKNSIKTQNRVYPGMRVGSNPIMTFPISLIIKILNKSQKKEWVDRIAKKIDVYAGAGNKKYKIEDIVSVTITPWKKVTIETSNNRNVILKSRRDENAPFKNLKASVFDDISIGHMPPLSEIMQELVKKGKLPILEDLTDKICSYFNNHSLKLDQVSLKKNYAMVYKKYVNSWTDEYRDKLYEELALIEAKEEYELQGRSDNISMGGINRK